MPDLAALPAGESVFVDTIIFDLHFRGKSVTCSAFMDRIAAGEVTGFVNTQVLSDMLHKLMLYEAASKGLIANRKAALLKQALVANRAIGGQLTDCQAQLEQVLAMGVQVKSITRKLLVESKAERQNHGLMTGDSLHLGNMNRHSAPIVNIATRDNDFRHINALTVWEPMDIVP